MYLVSVTFDVCVLNGNAHLLEMLHGFCTLVGFFSQSHASYLALMTFNGFGSVIQVNACVVVIIHTSGLHGIITLKLRNGKRKMQQNFQLYREKFGRGHPVHCALHNSYIESQSTNFRFRKTLIFFEHSQHHLNP